MFINYLQLKNFRNYDMAEINFSRRKTLLIGKNAQGKTNILESIYFLSCLTPLNAKNDSELIKWGSIISSIKANITKNEIDTDLETIMQQGKKKILKVNGLKKTKSSEFITQFSVVCFSVSDLLLLRGTPEDRRNWLDGAISQLYPAYYERILKYNKIKTQKNNYLKNLKNGVPLDQALLSVWNAQLVTCGANIIYLRMKFLSEIQKIAQNRHNHIANTEELSISYETKLGYIFNAQTDDVPSVEKIAQQFEQRLLEREQEELIRAQSLVGPHRDDVAYFINGIEAKKFASQGQQRTIVLSLKLAELEMIEKHLGQSPILLLDDVLAELDDLRQNYLLTSIKSNTQTIITSVDTLHFKEEYLNDVEIFKISQNSIEKLEQ